MAAVMTSCNNDNAEFIEQPAPVVQAQAPTQAPVQPKEDKAIEFDGYLYFAATTTQLEIFNNIYIVNVGDESFEVNLEKLDETSMKPEMQVSNINHYCAEYGEQTLKIFSFKIPVAVKYTSDVTAKATFSLKDGAQVPDEFVSFYGVSDKAGHGKFNQSAPILSGNANGYLNFVNRHTCNLN